MRMLSEADAYQLTPTVLLSCGFIPTLAGGRWLSLELSTLLQYVSRALRLEEIRRFFRGRLRG